MVRVSEQSRLTAHMRYLSTVTERMDRVQQQLATGRRIERASDDPAGASLALEHRTSIAFEAQMRRNLENGVAFMNVTEASLSSVTDALQRVRELTTQAANDTLSNTDRQSIAQEVNQIIEHLAQVANSEFGGAYVFSGHATQTPAYLVTGSPPTAVTFQGDAGERVRRISRQDTVAVNVTGAAVFGSIFSDLITLRDNLDLGASAATISSSLAAIDGGIDRTLVARAEIGSRINRFESALQQSEQTDTNLQELRSGIEETDLSEMVVRLTSEQNALQAALAAISSASGLSLLDYLR
ncbi:flagellar hook-associated protein 3 [bacterium]|nr:MAG: flagellar hook-associated protein 3 [bacterium]